MQITLRLCTVVLLTLGAGSVKAFELEKGVLADLPFIEPLDTEGPLYPGHIRIDLSPYPSRPLPMLLDTGAEHSVMTPLYARALRISVRKHRDSSYYRRSTLLGRDLEFLVDARSSDTGSRTGWEFGLLGANFLRPYVVEVDYQEKRVRFLDPKIFGVSEARAEPGEWVLPMRFTNGRPTVQIDIGSGTAHFLMDTGAPSDLILSEEKARQLEIEVPPNAETVMGQNVVGKARSLSFFVPAVRLGGHEVENLVLNVNTREGSTYRTTNIAGPDQAFLGNSFLSRFRVRFDYPNGKIALLPVVTPPPPEEVGPYLEAEEAAPQGGEAVATDPGQPMFVPVDLNPARAAVRYEQEVWLDLDAPTEQERVEGPVAWVEVRGWAGAGQRVEHDVVVIIDISGSTAYASGADVDGDGRVGRRSRRHDSWRSFNPARLSSDDGDTVLAAELLATRRLAERLNPGSTRVGIVSFASGARLDAPVGSSRGQLNAALDRLDRSFGSGMTNMEAAVDLAREALGVARPTDQTDRNQSILLLSDGYPTTPKNPQRAAYAAARRAAASGIRVHTFALGLGELQRDDVFVEMAFASGGSHVRVEDPAAIVHELSRVRLTDLASVEVENLSKKVRGRATRVFPDGSFDSLVPLTPGLNQIRVTAIGDSGGTAGTEREVFYQKRPPSPDGEELEAFLEKLRTRTIETRMAGEAQQAPTEDEGDRHLEIEPEKR
jgi:predicted aspartyl protease